MTGLWANRWWSVAASACGLMIGAGSALIFSFGIFLTGLGRYACPARRAA